MRIHLDQLYGELRSLSVPEHVMTRPVVICLFIFSLIGCSTHDVGSILPPELSLLVPWSPELQKTQPYAPPYYSQYSRAGRGLVFIASRHSTGSDSATFKTIREVIKEFRPEFVIAEGFEFSNAGVPKGLLRAVDSCVKEGFSNCAEFLYVVHLANIENIPVAGGEPSEAQILSEVIRRGYTNEDLLGYYIVRQTPQWGMEAENSGKNMDPYIAEFIELSREELALRSTYGPGDFKIWFRQKTGKEFVPGLIDAKTMAPSALPGATIINKLAFVTGRVRDEFISNLLWQKISQYKKVLIVYGSGHLPAQAPVLERMMGKPKIIKAF